MAAAASWERELLGLASRYEADLDMVDVLEGLVREGKLLAATEKLRRLMRLEAAKAGGNDGLFELRQRKEDGAVELVGMGGRMARRLRVREYEDVRLLDGTTQISARVDLLPPSQEEEEEEEEEEEGRPGASSVGKRRRQEQQQLQRPQQMADAVQLHFYFTRRPGPKRGSSMPYPAVEEEEEEEERSPACESIDPAGRCADGPCCGEEAGPTTAVEYSISVSPSAAEPPLQVLHVIIYGLHPSGAPSPRGIRGPDDEEEDEDDDGDGKEPKDLGLVELDNEALGAALQWCCGPASEWGELQFLSFLLFFPYAEEEYDVCNLVIDQVLGGDDNDEAPSVQLQPSPSPRSKQEQRKAKKRASQEQQDGQPSPPAKKKQARAR